MKYLAETTWHFHPSKESPRAGHRYFFPVETGPKDKWSLIVEPLNDKESIVYFLFPMAPQNFLKPGLELELALIKKYADIKIIKEVE